MTDTDETVTPTDDNAQDVQKSGEGEEPTDSSAPSSSPDYEPCGHPHAYGTCWFSQIAEPCGKRCKWLIDQGEDAGR